MRRLPNRRSIMSTRKRRGGRWPHGGPIDESGDHNSGTAENRAEGRLRKKEEGSMWNRGFSLVALSALAFGAAAAEQSPDAATQSRALEAARDYALNYTNRLPNFTCT